MAQPGWLDKQPIRLGLTQQAAQAYLERCTIHTTQAAARHFAQSNAVVILSEQGSVQTDLPELVDQHGPALVGRALGEQVFDQAGLAGAQRPGNHVGGNILQHQWHHSDRVESLILPGYASQSSVRINRRSSALSAGER